MASGRMDYTMGYVAEQSIAGREKSIFWDYRSDDCPADDDIELYSYTVIAGYRLWVTGLEIMTDSPSLTGLIVQFGPDNSGEWYFSQSLIWRPPLEVPVPIEPGRELKIQIYNTDPDVSIYCMGRVIGFFEKL